MDAATLYLIVTCQIGLPCPAPYFKREAQPEAFQYTRDACLAAARTYTDTTPKRAAYCAGNDGSILTASGRIVPEQEYYDAVDRWAAAFKASPSTSSTGR